MDDVNEVVFDDELAALSAELMDEAEEDGEPADDDVENPADSQDTDADAVDEDAEDDSEDVSDESDEDVDEDEDEEQVADLKTVSAMQKRINTLTAKSKSAESRAEELERQLEVKEAELQEKAGKVLTKYQTPQDVEQRITALRREVIPALEDEVDGMPNWTTDDVSGERIPNLVTIEGKNYEVRQVKRKIRELQEELSDLPKTKDQLVKTMADGAKARKLLPQAWKRGTPAFEARQAVLREFPGAAMLGDAAVVRLVLGKMALDRSTSRSVPKVKPGKGLKSGASTQHKKPQKKAVRVEGLDQEMAELAAVLDD